MAVAGASGSSPAPGGERLRLLCSHGGRFMPCGRDGALRYVGGETRALAVPRKIPFQELAARMADIAGAPGVAAVFRYPLADEGLHDVLVSVTCDDDLAHMVDEYDRLRAKRPSASFRVFVSTTAGAVRRHAAAQPQTIRRVQSEQVFSTRAHLRPHEADPATMRRAKSTQELAGDDRFPAPGFHHQRPQCCCCRRRRVACAPAAPPSRPMRALPFMPLPKDTIDLRPGRQEPAPPPSTAKAAGRVIFRDAEKGKARCSEVAVHEEKRAIWEFE